MIRPFDPSLSFKARQHCHSFSLMHYESIHAQRRKNNNKTVTRRHRMCPYPRCIYIRTLEFLIKPSSRRCKKRIETFMNHLFVAKVKGRLNTCFSGPGFSILYPEPFNLLHPNLSVLPHKSI